MIFVMWNCGLSISIWCYLLNVRYGCEMLNVIMLLIFMFVFGGICRYVCWFIILVMV